MTTISVDDYLAREHGSEVRHEYLGGVIYALAGASSEHNILAGNLFAFLLSHLRGKPCRVFISDVKLRLQIAGEDLFYYPDVMVTCDPRDTDRYFKRFPRLLIEVLSPETERTDRREKFFNYTQIETLEEYVLIAQDRTEATAFRRGNQWRPEVLRQPDELLRLNSVDCALPLRTIYEDVKVWLFAPLPPSSAQ